MKYLKTTNTIKYNKYVILLPRRSSNQEPIGIYFCLLQPSLSETNQHIDENQKVVLFHWPKLTVSSFPKLLGKMKQNLILFSCTWMYHVWSWHNASLVNGCGKTWISIWLFWGFLIIATLDLLEMLTILTFIKTSFTVTFQGLLPQVQRSYFIEHLSMAASVLRE